MGIILYGLLIVYWEPWIVQVTAFIAVAVLLAILAWIGYTMATTPPPEPIADIPEPSTGGAPGPAVSGEQKKD